MLLFLLCYATIIDKPPQCGNIPEGNKAMALTQNDYIQRAAGTGIYSVAEMDREYNSRRVRIAAANPTNDVYSVAKIFTVTAIGICRDRGMLDVNDRFLDIMEISLPDGADPRWKNVTLHMLMKHTAGFSRGLLDIDVDNASLYPTTDYLSMVLAEPLPAEQGVTRQYTDAAYYLLSRIVEKVSGVTLFEFLRPALMDTMRFGEYAWSSCPLGHTMGATGLYIRCEDMVKLGVLYLNGGMWHKTRIVSEEWCRIVLERGYEFTHRGVGEWYGKGGMHGQMLALNPDLGLAVAWQGYSRSVSFEAMLG